MGDLNKTEADITAKMPAIILNASSEFIARYKLVRSNYYSLKELATTTNADDQRKFSTLWEELLLPIQHLTKQRDEQFSSLYARLSLSYTLSQKELSIALATIQNKQSNPNARDAGCQTLANTNRDQAFDFCISYGYGYDFSRSIAEDVYLDTLDACNGERGPQWC